MTKNEFLDNEKSRGFTIYRCVNKTCDFRGYGASAAYHELNPYHYCYNEDSAEYSQMKYGNMCPECKEWHTQEVACAGKVKWTKANEEQAEDRFNRN